MVMVTALKNRVSVFEIKPGLVYEEYGRCPVINEARVPDNLSERTNI